MSTPRRNPFLLSPRELERQQEREHRGTGADPVMRRRTPEISAPDLYKEAPLFRARALRDRADALDKEAESYSKWDPARGSTFYRANKETAERLRRQADEITMKPEDYAEKYKPGFSDYLEKFAKSMSYGIAQGAVDTLATGEHLAKGIGGAAKEIVRPTEMSVPEAFEKARQQSIMAGVGAKVSEDAQKAYQSESDDWQKMHGKIGTFADLVDKAVYSSGNMVPSLLVGGIASSLASGTKATKGLGKILSKVNWGNVGSGAAIFATANAASTKEALQKMQTMTDASGKPLYSEDEQTKRAAAAGVLNGLIEGVGEYAIGGAFGAGNGLLKSALSNHAKGLAKAASNPVARAAAQYLLINPAGEGAEEMVQNVLSYFANKATYDKEAEFEWAEFLESGAVGALMSIGGGLPYAVQNTAGGLEAVRMVSEYGKAAEAAQTKEQAADTAIAIAAQLTANEKAIDSIKKNLSGEAAENSTETYKWASDRLEAILDALTNDKILSKSVEEEQAAEDPGRLQLLTPEQAAAQTSELAKDLKKYGVKNVVVDPAQTFFDRRTGEMHISKDTSTKTAINIAAAHEIVHAAVTGDASLVPDILQAMRETGADVDAMQAAAKKEYGTALPYMANITKEQAAAEVTDAYAAEEVAAKFVQGLEESEHLLEKIAKSKPNILERIYDAVLSVIDRLTGKDPMKRKYRRLSDRIRKALNDAGYKIERTGKAQLEALPDIMYSGFFTKKAQRESRAADRRLQKKMNTVEWDEMSPTEFESAAIMKTKEWEARANEAALGRVDDDTKQIYIEELINDFGYDVLGDRTDLRTSIKLFKLLDAFGMEGAKENIKKFKGLYVRQYQREQGQLDKDESELKADAERAEEAREAEEYRENIPLPDEQNTPTADYNFRTAPTPDDSSAPPTKAEAEAEFMQREEKTGEDLQKEDKKKESEKEQEIEDFLKSSESAPMPDTDPTQDAPIPIDDTREESEIPPDVKEQRQKAIEKQEEIGKSLQKQKEQADEWAKERAAELAKELDDLNDFYRSAGTPREVQDENGEYISIPGAAEKPEPDPLRKQFAERRVLESMREYDVAVENVRKYAEAQKNKTINEKSKDVIRETQKAVQEIAPKTVMQEGEAHEKVWASTPAEKAKAEADRKKLYDTVAKTREAFKSLQNGDIWAAYAAGSTAKRNALKREYAEVKEYADALKAYNDFKKTQDFQSSESRHFYNLIKTIRDAKTAEDLKSGIDYIMESMKVSAPEAGEDAVKTLAEFLSASEEERTKIIENAPKKQNAKQREFYHLLDALETLQIAADTLMQTEKEASEAYEKRVNDTLANSTKLKNLKETYERYQMDLDKQKFFADTKEAAEQSERLAKERAEIYQRIKDNATTSDRVLAEAFLKSADQIAEEEKETKAYLDALAVAQILTGEGEAAEAAEAAEKEAAELEDLLSRFSSSDEKNEYYRQEMIKEAKEQNESLFQSFLEKGMSEEDAADAARIEAAREARRQAEAKTAMARLGYHISGAVTEEYSAAETILYNEHQADKTLKAIRTYIKNFNVSKTVIDKAKEIAANGELLAESGLEGQLLTQARALSEMYRQYYDYKAEGIKSSGKAQTQSILRELDAVFDNYEWDSEKTKYQNATLLNLANPENVMIDVFGENETGEYLAENYIRPVIENSAEALRQNNRMMERINRHKLTRSESAMVQANVEFADAASANGEYILSKEALEGIFTGETDVESLVNRLSEATPDKHLQKEQKTFDKENARLEKRIKTEEKRIARLEKDIANRKSLLEDDAALKAAYEAYLLSTDENMIPDTFEAFKAYKQRIVSELEAESKRAKEAVTDAESQIAENNARKKETFEEQKTGYDDLLVALTEVQNKALARAKEEALKKTGEKEWEQLSDNQQNEKVKETAEALAKESAQKVYEASKDFASLLNDMYEALNEISVIHGRPEIKYLKNYMPHQQPAEVKTQLDEMMAIVGLEPVTDLPASIAGNTSERRPFRKWLKQAQHRTGNRTTYDAVTNIEKYIKSSNEAIYHIDDIMKLRHLESYVRNRYSEETLDYKAQVIEELYQKGRGEDDLAERQKLSKELKEDKTKLGTFVTWLKLYTDDLAGKQVLARDVENKYGRQALNIMGHIVDWSSRTLVQGNLASAFKQTAQVPLVVGEVGAKIAKQAAELVSDSKNSIEKTYHVLERSTVVAEKQKRIYAELLGDKSKAGEFMEKASETVFGTADKLMTSFSVYSYFLKAQSEGQTVEESIRYADRMTRASQSSRMRGAAPLMFRSKDPVTRLLMLFQRETVAQWERLVKVLPREYRAYAEKHGKKKASEVYTAGAVGTLLATFAYNQAMNLIGLGTPAMFDLLGWALDWTAGGSGIVLEMLAHAAGLDDDPEDDEDGILSRLWNGIKEGTKNDFRILSEMSEDLPIISNIAAMLGLTEDGRIPLAKIDLTGTKNLKKNLDSLQQLERELRDTTDPYLISEIKKERNSVYSAIQYNIFGQLVDASAFFIPSGNQVRKSIRGIMALLTGGDYSAGGKAGDLRYALNPANNFETLKAIAFGKSSTKAAQEWIKSGFDGFSKTETKAYEALVLNRADRDKAAAAVKALSSVPVSEGQTRTEAQWQFIKESALTDRQKAALYEAAAASDRERIAFSSVSRNNHTESVFTAADMRGKDTQAEKIDILLNSGLDNETKEILYRELVGSYKTENGEKVLTDAERISVFKSESLSFDDFLSAKLKHKEIEDRDITAAQKADAFAVFAHEKFGSSAGAVIDSMPFSSGFKVKPEKLEEMVEAGLPAQKAETALNAYRSALSDKKKENPDARLSTSEKLRTASGLEMTDDERLITLQSQLPDSTFAKVEAAQNEGISLDVYADFLENADANGNGSITNIERTNALNLAPLTRRQKAALWEISGGHPDSNPYTGGGKPKTMPKFTAPKFTAPKFTAPKFGG